MQRRNWFLLVCVLLTGAVLSAVVDGADDAARGVKSERPQPQELGAIKWRRDFDKATAEAKRTGKPLLVLFQEVPGCGTCKGYGDRVLSHPLVRDAAETLFVPVAIYNNTPGNDARVLKKFEEPAWNNPVVRIVSHDRTALASRVAGDYTTTGLVSAMVAALVKEKRDVPTYLRLLNEELTARKRGLAQATFAMYCFWEGEGQLGGLDGVIATKPGYLRGREVVDVWYDPARITYSKLVKQAQQIKCAGTVYARSERQEKAIKALRDVSIVRTDEKSRPDKEPKYFLSKTPYRFVPMTATQASRVNAAIHSSGDPVAILSPSQLRLLASIKAHPNAGWRNVIGTDDLHKAFSEAKRVAASDNS